MPENVNWDAVFQSFTDTWLPLVGGVAVVIAVVVIVKIVKGRKKK